MWIFTPTAMLSVVAHRSEPGMLMIRARLKGDIQRVFPGARVVCTPKADYRFRTTVPRAAVAAVLANLAGAIDYPNVKDAIPKTGRVHDVRHRAMNRVWAAMHDAQTTLAPKRRSYLQPEPPARGDVGDLGYAPSSLARFAEFDRDLADDRGGEEAWQHEAFRGYP
jgi:hypothetical protein